MIFVNFKTYQQGTGERALSLAKICAEVEKETGIKIIPIVQAVDIFRLASQGLNVWAQHMNDIDFGPHTGQILPEALKEAGAKGVLLNHAEKKLSLEELKKIMEKRQDFQTLVCSESIEEGQQIATLKPDFLAYEPPELIGGAVSVSQAKPEIISDFVAKIKEVPILVGAGVHQKEDIKKALELGAKGVLVSSNVVLSENPKQELLNLAGGFI
jgi:triosephosphate isomerase (TIM)